MAKIKRNVVMLVELGDSVASTPYVLCSDKFKNTTEILP